MKGLLWFALWGLAILGAKEAGTDRHPLMVDASGDWCDVPSKRAPILRTPNNKADYRLGKPFNDKGTA